MQVNVPTYSYGTSSVIGGNFTVVDRLDYFLDHFEQLVSQEIDAAVREEQDAIRKAASNDSSWADISENIHVTYEGNRLVYSVDDSAADVAANNEYGVDPKPLLRTHAMKARNSVGKKLGKQISKVVPVA